MVIDRVGQPGGEPGEGEPVEAEHHQQDCHQECLKAATNVARCDQACQDHGEHQTGGVHRHRDALPRETVQHDADQWAHERERQLGEGEDAGDGPGVGLRLRIEQQVGRHADLHGAVARLRQQSHDGELPEPRMAPQAT
jgi:hypothetical protein